jgi:hypothetical protein
MWGPRQKRYAPDGALAFRSTLESQKYKNENDPGRSQSRKRKVGLATIGPQFFVLYAVLHGACLGAAVVGKAPKSTPGFVEQAEINQSSSGILNAVVPSALVSIISNLRTLCSTCNQGAKNITTEKPSTIWLKSQVRCAGIDEQRAVYE